MAELAPLRTALWQRWCATLAPFDLTGMALAPAFTHLADAYSAPERYYHTLDHLADVLDVIAEFHGFVQLSLVELAAWFHDVVYDTHAADNEEKSSAWAGETLQELGLPRNVIERTQGLIALTKRHEAPADDMAAAILLDADLAILGADLADYARYAVAIRREYAWVSDADYRAARRRVLETFLGRERIYRTEQLYAARDARARDNIRREIGSLDRPD
jgi:predicted metal-dependent HD superfamily phosphohydrolase